MSTKRIVIGLGVVIAIALGILSYKGVIPPKSGVEGTIGAAKRYQTTQIAAGDVQLTDADMQDLLQSDLFHQLVTDENFRKVVNTQGDAFRTVLASKTFRDAMGKTGFPEVMRSAVFKTAVEQNKYDLLAKATASDYQKTQLVERTQSLDRQSLDAMKTQLAAARTEVERTQSAYNKSVEELLKVNVVAERREMVAKVEQAKSQDMVARTQLAKAQLQYEKAANAAADAAKLEQAKTEVAKAELGKTDLAKTQPTAERRILVEKMEQAKAELAKANLMCEKTSTAYRQAVADLSKAQNVAGRQEVAKVEQSRTSADAARAELARTSQTLERTVNMTLDRTAEAQRANQMDASRTANTDAGRTALTTEANAYAQAQELARSEQMKTLFADQNFRQLARSDLFAKVITTQKLQQVAKMENFQRVVNSSEAWKNVVVDRTAETERTATSGE